MAFQWRSNGSIIDTFANRTVGWRAQRSPQTQFVLDALEQALHECCPVSGDLIHHRDRASQYVSIRYTERLAPLVTSLRDALPAIGAGIEPFVASVGDSDAFKLVRASGLNDTRDRSKAQTALAETITGLLKAEVIYRFGPWKSADAVEWEPLKWVDWVTHRRLLQPIRCRQAMLASPRGQHPTGGD